MTPQMKSQQIDEYVHLSSYASQVRAIRDGFQKSMELARTLREDMLVHEHAELDAVLAEFTNPMQELDALVSLADARAERECAE